MLSCVRRLVCIMCVRCRVCAVCVVPVSVWRRTPQPCFPSRRERTASRPHRSAIVRLRSGAVASRSGAFRIAAFRCGGGGPRGWHGRAGASARRSLRPRLPVRLGVRATYAHERHPAWSEYLPAPPAAPVRRCAHPAARARSGPVLRRASAGALVAHVRFCGARPRTLK